MPKKKNRYGMQNYDWQGRYCSNNETIARKKEHDTVIRERDRWLDEHRKKEAAKEALRNRALHKKDPYLVEAFDLINGAAPNSIKKVNDEILDNSNIKREIDILTKHCLVEIKKTGKGSFNQLMAQKDYCKSKKLVHIIYSPDMPYGRKKEFERHGLTIVCKPNALIDIIKRYEK